MDEKDGEHYTTELYVTDCEAAIRRVDKAVFVNAGKAPAQVFVIDEFPDAGITGEHIGRVLSFFRHYPGAQLFPNEHIVRLENTQECYVIWRRQLIRKIERMLANPNHSGLGDHALQGLWFMMGVGLVRRRVLYRKEWFPDAKLRDTRALRKHAHLLGDDIFLALRNLELKHEGNDERPVVLDIHLTQELVTAAQNSGTLPA